MYVLTFVLRFKYLDNTSKQFESSKHTHIHTNIHTYIHTNIQRNYRYEHNVKLDGRTLICKDLQHTWFEAWYGVKVDSIIIFFAKSLQIAFLPGTIADR